MKTSTIVWIVIILIILVGGWYIWMQSSVPAPQPTTTVATSTAGTQNPNSIQNNLTLGTDSTSTIGTYLIGYNGMTLYTYAKDSTGTSTCYGECAQNWPPYFVPAGMGLNVESGIDGQTGTITRADGTTQVTYNGMPL